VTDKFFIDRPPRIEPELPSGVFTIPNPPDTQDAPNQVISQAFLPMIMILGYILVSLLGQGRNMMMMIPMMLSVIGSVALAVYSYTQDKKKREEQAAAYKRRISELRRKMESEHEQQRIYYFYNYPEPDKNLTIAADIHKPANAQQEAIRSGTRLWERRPLDHDFLYLRLGLSTRQSTVTYKISENEKTDSPLMLEATRLAEDSRLIFDVPVTIPLYQPSDDTEKKKVEAKTEEKEGNKKQVETQESKGITVRHAIGITGSSPTKVNAYVRTLLIDYATHHSPQDTMLYVAGTNEARQHWRWAYPLPHCKEADKTETLCFEEDERPGETEPDRMRLFWKNVRTILERRRMRLQDRESGADVRLPFMLVVVDVQTPTPEWSALHDLEGEATISTILLDGQKLGAGILFLVPDRSKVPGRSTAVIEVDEDPADENAAVFRYAETGFNTVRYVGTTHLVTTQELARDFARNLEPLDIRRGYGSTLASTVTLLEMLNVTTLDELQAMTRDNWKRSMNPKIADWLFTAVGLLSGNEPRVLTFSAKADGVHGIIAGSTGSGKSELLMTLIIGLALNFNPDVLNFVLIDYKGGAAFEPFKRLPHKVDIVTNLDQSATARVFASIIAELDRRQKLNTYTNSKDIVHYRKKGLNLDPQRPPYPHLFIIIDEFAEMIAGNAEYKAQLESITRLGRALGVTLILAAQRPAGVTDQMRANIKFRICLRVETPDDSREVLRRADAAFLPPGIPGRGYLQVGNENIELIQTAYTGGDYKGPQEENVVPNVIWLDRPKKSAAQKATEPPKLYDVIVEMLGNMAEQESRPQWRPWPEFLPSQSGRNVLSLTTPLDTAYMSDEDIDLLRGGDTDRTGNLTLNDKAVTFLEDNFDWPGIQWGKNAMRPLIGLVDNPYQASQRPLFINFTAGHAVVFGASGRGKTTFLRTVITSLTLTHSPDELHIYIFDFGGRALTVLSDLPHVGAVVTSEEEERVLRGLRKVNEIIDHRQIIFSEARVNSLDSYNLSHADKPLPAVLVVLDNFAEFKEYYENLMPPLISLVREARAYGVHFLFSADMPNALTSKLFNLVTERFTLKLSDATEYATIVGRGVPADLSPVPGRGYVRVGNMPLEFQTALTFPNSESDPDGMAEIGRMCTRMAELWGNRWKGEKPSTIETLPLRVSLENILRQASLPEVRRINAVMGIDDRSLMPALIDVERQGPHMIVIGQPFSGKTTTLRTMILSIAHSYSPDEVMMVLIDYSRKLWKADQTSLADLPHVVQTIEDIEQLDPFYEALRTECADFDTHPKRRKIMIFIDNYDAFTEESSRKKMAFFENVAALIRKYQTAGVYMVVGGSVSITSASDDLRKVFAAPNFGIALKSADAVNRLNGKFPRSLADTDLPMGRAFTVRSGITNMLQIATPYANDEDTEGSLDTWVRNIQRRYSQPKVQWLNKDSAPAPATPAEAPTLTTATSGNAGYTPQAQPDLGKYDINTLKKLLIESGTPEDLIGMLSPSDIVETARAMGLISDQPDQPA
jgi:DNA segregation ATPase FtsK/SpoIIIE-like protein